MAEKLRDEKPVKKVNLRKIDNTRAVRQYSLNGVFKTEYPSLRAIAKRRDLCWDTYFIKKCLDGETASSYNSLWRYADSDDLAGVVSKPVTLSAPDENVVQATPADSGDSMPIDPELMKRLMNEPVSSSEADIKFTNPLHPCYEWTILGPGSFGYGVLNIDTQETKSMFPAEMFSRKLAGDTIHGCSFYTNGLAFDIEGLGRFTVPMEVWREFSVGLCCYEVSNLGHVRTSEGASEPVKNIKPFQKVNPSGMSYCVELPDGHGETLVYELDILVTIAFVQHPDTDAEIVHLDGDASNCALGNLSCCVDAADFGKFEVEPFNEMEFAGVRRYDMKTGAVCCYSSVSEAAVRTSCSASGVRGSCDNMTVSYNGFVWRYGTDGDTLFGMSADARIAEFGRIVHQYDCTGKLIGEYVSVADAAAAVGYSFLSIENACNRTDRLGYVGEFVWRFANDDEFYELSESDRRCRFQFDSVHQYSYTGKLIATFSSYGNAAKAVGSRANVIANACGRGSLSVVSGCIWRHSKDDELFLAQESERCSILGLKPVRRYTKSGSFAGEFCNVVAGSTKTQSAVDEIMRCAERDAKHPSVLGYVWRYVDDDELNGMSQVERAKALGYSCVRQYSADGEFVKEYVSVYAAVEATGVSKEKITRSCKHGKLDSCDFIWRYAWDDELIILSKEDRALVLSNFVSSKEPDGPVKQYDFNGDCVGTFETCSAAGAELNVHAAVIRHCCNRVSRFTTVSGYVWRFESDDEFAKMSDEVRVATFAELVKNSKKSRCVRKYNLDGDMVGEFTSIKEAGRNASVSYQAISQSCHSDAGKLIVSGHVWRREDDDDLFLLSKEQRKALMLKNRPGLGNRPATVSDEKPAEQVGVEKSDDCQKQTVVKPAETVGAVKQKPLDKEIWCAILDHNIEYPDGSFKYEVSDKGRVRVRGSSKGEDYSILTQTEAPYGGQLFVRLVDEMGKSHVAYVDSLVASVFVRKPVDCDKIWHKDGDVLNNHAGNLMWYNKRMLKDLRRAK